MPAFVLRSNAVVTLRACYVIGVPAILLLLLLIDRTFAAFLYVHTRRTHSARLAGQGDGKPFLRFMMFASAMHAAQLYRISDQTHSSPSTILPPGVPKAPPDLLWKHQTSPTPTVDSHLLFGGFDKVWKYARDNGMENGSGS